MNAPLQLNAELKRAAIGNTKAQEIIFRQFYPFVKEVARRYGRSESDTESIIFNSFLELYERLKFFDPTAGSFKTFLKNIVVTRAVLGRTITYIPTALPALQDWSGLPPELVEVRLRELPSGVQTILALSAVEGYTETEIAQYLNIKEPSNLQELKQLTRYIQAFKENITHKLGAVKMPPKNLDLIWEEMNKALAARGLTEAERLVRPEPVAAELPASIPEPIDPVEGQWAGWAFLFVLIAASIIMLYLAGIIR